MDGFWIHRVLQSEANRKPRCRCRVDFDLAPPAPSEDRRDRWGRRSVRTLFRPTNAGSRGCARWSRRLDTRRGRPPPDLPGKRKTLVGERVEHVNRVKGLLFAQGVSDYEPLKA